MLTKPNHFNPFSILRFWVPHSLQNLKGSSSMRRTTHHCNAMVVINNTVFCSAPEQEEEAGEAAMEAVGLMEKSEEVVVPEGRNEECQNETFFAGLVEEKNEVAEGNDEEYGNNGCESENFLAGLVEEKNEVAAELIEDKSGGERSSGSEVLSSDETEGHEEEHCQSSVEDSSSHEMDVSNCNSPNGSEDADKKEFDIQVQVLPVLEVEMMKERFAKLLLGEDMSGCGNGVPTALAISNAITNLCATLFGQLWRLEPLATEKKGMWRREMEWLLCVSDHIVELKPTWQTFPDGSKLEVMTCRPRSDLYVNLPALRKLDNMLLEILDSFSKTEFRYVEQGVVAPDAADGSSSFRRALQRQEEKWWLPVPQVPPCGLDENSRKQLQHKRDCANQILKAAMAINSITLAEMDIPVSYLESLPKTARASLGDVIYRYIISDNFSPECLLACLDLSSEHQAIEIANRVEASIYIWQRRTSSKPAGRTTRYSSRSSWEMFKDLIVEGDKSEMLVERAETLLLSLKQRYPGLPQTALDTSKIQCNKDVGKSILESYSRVLESLASNIVARIDDVLYVDDLTKHSDQFSCVTKVGVIPHKTSISFPYSVSVQSSPFNKSGFGKPTFSQAQGIIGSAKGEKSPFINSNTKNNIVPQQGKGVNDEVLTDFLTIDKKGKEYGCPIEKLAPTLAKFDQVQAFETDMETTSDCTEDDVKHKALEQAWIE